MSHEVIDLRSDTVTRPTEGMRRVLSEAPVGDDVFGEDPSVQGLEAAGAEAAGKEAALFVPSGSMANLLVQLCVLRPGDEVIVGREAHILRHEVGSGAALAGALYEVVPGDGRVDAEQVAERIRPPTFHTPGTALVWIENTHNMGGGRVTPPETVEAVGAVCRRHRLHLHLDGARIFNAAAACGRPVRDLAAAADSISFCLSKGLGAPVGSLLCGTADFRTRALRFRKMLGGGMRQAGILAAAGLYALRHHVARLPEDHRHARRLAEGLADVPGLRVDPSAVETNIVMVDVPGGTAEAVRDGAAAHGVRCLALGPRRLRFVTHLDVDGDDIERALGVLRRVAVGAVPAS